ncbi:MAG: nucleotidyltransferase domain-containing protein [bacterium]|nr:nucleotidyltransferase domain-containing protein [bacterium]
MDEILSRVVDRIVSVASPSRIILFGSLARGESGPDSDFDLLVVVPPDRHRRKTAQAIYRNLVDLGSAVDVVVVTTADLERYRDHPGMVIRTAVDEGRELYAA